MTTPEKVHISETVQGVVQRVTYHDPKTGWSVLRVESYDRPGEQITVIVHQTKVFAGASMRFRGGWTHSDYGEQFKATEAIEQKPATTAALEKYLGSGLIKGVGPKTAKKIVGHFGPKTMDIFDREIERLIEIPGIAKKKLVMISEAWTEHRLIRDVMIFLQGHNISTLFAVRIFQKYGDRSIQMVTEDPYRLSIDFYGIGFFSADQVALSIGLAPDSRQRIVAAIRHKLSASRELGHCFLTLGQIVSQVSELLELDLAERIPVLLKEMEEEGLLKARKIPNQAGDLVTCYYSKTLYYAEKLVADTILKTRTTATEENVGVAEWIDSYCREKDIQLSDEQADAVRRIADCSFSILTGGPGCGKTTTTLVIVKLLEEHLGLNVMLAAPTGRAAQRMGEVIGQEAKTLHRLLEWQHGEFTRNEENPLEADIIIVDECSMLDISLGASLFKAIPEGGRLLMIGDADQLMPVGAGCPFKNLIESNVVSVFRLTKVFRQAQGSDIITYAHQINYGQVPAITSPFKEPEIWQGGSDCLFIDSDEPTKEQMSFVSKVKRTFKLQTPQLEALHDENEKPYSFRTSEPIRSAGEPEFTVPEKFKHVDLEQVAQAEGEIEELKSVLKKIHPWSTLHYGLSAIDTIVRLYTEWIPKYCGKDCEIQILSPMTRGSLGTVNLNKIIQAKANPPADHKPELQIGERIFRLGDRVIHKRNNYDLGVFNGDIGKITAIDTVELTCVVTFFPDDREVEYQKEDMVELDSCFATSIHKSQGSEFGVTVIPVHTQHFRMLYRNLIYTGLTRARKLCIFVGTRRALSMAVRQQDTSKRQTALTYLLQNPNA